MPNGKPGDHRFTDILHYGSSEFGEPVDGLVKEIANHPRFAEVRDQVANLLWENSPIGRTNERIQLLEQTIDRLRAIKTSIATPGMGE